MLIKDQLRGRMEEKKISIAELANMLGVSGQTIRHWLNGRSFPGKRKAPELEKALSFSLDYSEGKGFEVEDTSARTDRPFADPVDIELALTISKLSRPLKKILLELAREIIRSGEVEK